MDTFASSNTITRVLLQCGVIAGPVYVFIGLVQALTRSGFDITRHDLSLLSNGSLGWIQVANFLLSGGLTVCTAIGMKRVLSRSGGRTWGPLLLGLYGIGLIGAGIFDCALDTFDKTQMMEVYKKRIKKRYEFVI
jgi:hypothetical membrane protein